MDISLFGTDGSKKNDGEILRLVVAAHIKSIPIPIRIRMGIGHGILLF